MGRMLSSVASLCVVVFWVCVFYVGWFVYPETNTDKTVSHAMGLKFMPPCTPLLGNATCGYDLLLVFPFALSFVLIISLLFSSKEWEVSENGK